MRQRAHVTGTLDDHQPAVGQQLCQAFRNHAVRHWRVLAAQDEHGKLQRAVGACRRRVLDERLEVEWPLGRPADQGVLHRRTHRLPGAWAIPIIDEGGDSPAIVAGHHALADAPCNAGDLRVGLGARLAHLSQ